MAPLQRIDIAGSKHPLWCPPTATEAADLHGGSPYRDLGHTKPGTNEAHGYQGAFTPGVTTWRGGAHRSTVAPPSAITNRGTVLYSSSTLQCSPPSAASPSLKAGTSDEREGRSGQQARGGGVYSRPRPFIAQQERSSHTNRGVVLFASETLAPKLAGNIASFNVAGGRPTERFGAVGGFTAGPRIWGGGAPRDVPIAPELNHGTVLSTSDDLEADMSWDDGHYKEGTDERQGRCGSFEAGRPTIKFSLPTAAQWTEPGQRCGARRFAGGHFLAGATTWCGVSQRYDMGMVTAIAA